MPTHTAGLILAAGLGRRFGGGKMLADVGGRPMLQHVIDLAAAADLDPVVVVVGNDADQLDSAIDWRGDSRVRNPDPSRGIASSVRLGLAALPLSNRVIVLLGDQPHLTVEQVGTLTQAPRDPGRPIVVPRYEGVPGNPVQLEREAIPLAAQLEGDRGMSQLFATPPDLVRYVDLTGTNPDIDTAEDLALFTPA